MTRPAPGDRYSQGGDRQYGNALYVFLRPVLERPLDVAERASPHVVHAHPRLLGMVQEWSL